jgi:hypothetical protein
MQPDKKPQDSKKYLANERDDKISMITGLASILIQLSNLIIIDENDNWQTVLVKVLSTIIASLTLYGINNSRSETTKDYIRTQGAIDLQKVTPTLLETEINSNTPTTIQATNPSNVIITNP